VNGKKRRQSCIFEHTGFVKENAGKPVKGRQNSVCFIHEFSQNSRYKVSPLEFANKGSYLWKKSERQSMQNSEVGENRTGR